MNEFENDDLRRELAEVGEELSRLSNDRRELVEQAIHFEKLAAAEHARAERQLDIHFARQYCDKAKSLEKNAKDLRQQARKLEKIRDDLEQCR